MGARELASPLLGLDPCCLQRRGKLSGFWFLSKINSVLYQKRDLSIDTVWIGKGSVCLILGSTLVLQPRFLFCFREKKPRPHSGDHENLMNVVSVQARVCVCTRALWGISHFSKQVPASLQAEGSNSARDNWLPGLSPCAGGLNSPWLACVHAQSLHLSPTLCNHCSKDAQIVPAYRRDVSVSPLPSSSWFISWPQLS